MHNDTDARFSGSGAAPRREDALDPPGHGESLGASNKSGSNPEGKSSGASKTKRRSTLTAWWFARKLIVLALFAGALTGGLYLGFVFLGKGSPGDAFDVVNYKHIYDLIFSDS